MNTILLNKVFELLSDNSVYVPGTDITLEILTQKHYIFLEVSSLTITFGSTKSEEVNRFSFEFDSGSTPTILTLPNSIGYVNGSPTIEANAHYYFEIEKSYDGRYFCKYEKYTGGGSFIPISATIISWTSSLVTMSTDVTQQDVINHLLIITDHGTAQAYSDQMFGIAIKLGSSMCGVASINGNKISISYSGPQITDIQWV